MGYVLIHINKTRHAMKTMKFKVPRSISDPEGIEHQQTQHALITVHPKGIEDYHTKID